MDWYVSLPGGTVRRAVDLDECGRWTEQSYGKSFADGGRVVGRDDVGGVGVSTVMLGLDHGWGGRGPLLFETMIFGGPHDGYQDRYATHAEAVAGHAAAVKLAKGES